jgi:hypothetical protein
VHSEVIEWSEKWKNPGYFEKALKWCPFIGVIYKEKVRINNILMSRTRDDIFIHWKDEVERSIAIDLTRDICDSIIWNTAIFFVDYTYKWAPF